MKATDQIKHAAFEKTLDYLLEDPERNATKIMDMLDKVAPADLFPSQRTAFRNAIDQQSNWHQLITRVLELNPAMRNDFIKTFLVDGNLMAWPKQETMREKHRCNVPWAILLDPTSACNLHCKGCWAAEYGNKLNLTYDEIDSIIRQGKEMGTYFYIYTGGEPLVRKKDLIKLCEVHSDAIFMCFTNGTLIDEQFAADMMRVKNFVPVISVEGYEESMDSRRGDGTYQRAVKAMNLLKSHRLPFGNSICYTSVNIKDVSTEAYVDQLVDWGSYFVWYFHYMPVGKDAVPELLPSPEQREHMYHQIRTLRGKKPIFHAGLPERRRVCGRLHRRRPALPPHQRQWRLRPLRVHSLLRLQHPGKDPAGGPALPPVHGLPRRAALQRQPPASLPHAGESREAAGDRPQVRRPSQRCHRCGRGRRSVRQM